jgi:cold shock CspA family protein
VTGETRLIVLTLPLAEIMHDGHGNGRLLDLTKQIGFVALSNGYGDAFLHMSVLKQAGYVWLPRGTTVRVRIEAERGKQRVAEVLEMTPALPDRARTSRLCASPRPERPKPSPASFSQAPLGNRAPLRLSALVNKSRSGTVTVE